MPGLLSSIAGQAAGAAINTGMGLLLEGHNDRRQLEQQRKLSQQQADIDYMQLKRQNELALQMWKDTNYTGQVERKRVSFST